MSDIGKSIEKAGRAVIELPKSLIDETVGLISNGVEDTITSINDVAGDIVGNVSKTINNVMNVTEKVVSRPPDAIQKHGDSIGRKMRTHKIE